MKTLLLLIAASSLYGQTYTPVSGSSAANTLDAQINTRFTDVYTLLGLKQPMLTITSPLRLISNTIDCPTCVTIPYVLTQANILTAIGAGTLTNAYLATPYITINGNTIALGGTVTISTAGTYSLPLATGSVLGGIKIGSGLSIDGAGVVSATGGSGSSTFAGLTDAATASIASMNTSVSTALGLKAPLASPVFTGTPTIPDFTNATHAHTGASSGGIVSHLNLSNVGTNTHAQIDTALGSAASHAANTSNPHTTTKAQVGLGSVPNVDATNATNIASGTLDVARLPAGAVITAPTTGSGMAKFNGSTNTITYGAAGTDYALPNANTTGNASTATALAANGTNCSAGNYPLGVDTGGNAEGCTAAATGTVTGVTGTGAISVTGTTAPVVSVTMGTASGTVAAGNDSRIVGALQKPIGTVDLVDTYSASNSGGTTTTTSGTFAVGTSGSVASCSSFTASQGVYIAGAGASGAKYIGTVVSCTGTTLTINPATSTSVSSGTVVQHDETEAFRSAITYLGANGGGTIALRDGVYLVNGSPVNSCGESAIIGMPCRPYFNGTGITISILGNTWPNQYQLGAIITTSATTGNLFGGNYTGTEDSPVPFTYVWLSMENVTINAPSNPGVVAINAQHIAGFRGNRLAILAPGSTPSNSAGAGILMPIVGNNDQSILDDVTVSGYYTGIGSIGEHSVLGRVIAVGGHECFVFDLGTYLGSGVPYGVGSLTVLNMATSNCVHAISAGSTQNSYINVLQSDFDVSNTVDIYDPSNFLHGSITGKKGNTGNTPGAIGVTGAANLSINNTWAPLASQNLLGATTTAALNVTGVFTATNAAQSNFTNATGPAGVAVFTTSAGTTAYQVFSVGQYPNWLQGLFIPPTATGLGGIYQPSTAILRSDIGATSLLIDSGANGSALNLATEDVTRLALTSTGASFSVPITGVPDVQLSSTATSCTSSVRGRFNYVAGATGVKDIVQVCAKDASNAYAWRAIY